MHVATYAGALKVTNLISEQEEVLICAEDIRDKGAFISASTVFKLVLQAKAELTFANLKKIIAYLVLQLQSAGEYLLSYSVVLVSDFKSFLYADHRRPQILNLLNLLKSIQKKKYVLSLLSVRS